MLVSGSGIDLQEALIQFIEHCEVRNSTLYLLMAEITRHRLFSVAGYMRWLIASGELPKVHELNKVIICGPI